MAPKNQKARRVARALGAIASMTVVYPGCGDGQKEKLRAVELAEGCILDSECSDPLVCAFEICHAMCDTDKDCVRYGYGRCMKVDGKEKAGVCQLPGEQDCRRDPKQCVAGGRNQACADDGQCRDRCNDTLRPCLAGLECSASGYCARGAELDANGELTGAGGASGEAGGTGGTGAVAAGGTGGLGVGDEGGEGGEGYSGSGGTGGTTAPTTGGVSGDSGAGGEGGQESSTEDAGAPGMSAAGAGGEGGGAVVTPVSEQEPNDDNEHPNLLEAGTPVTATLATREDQDFFAITAPEDGAGGYFEFAVTEVGNGRLVVRVWPEIYTGTFLVGNSTAAGASLFGYFAAAPGETYFIQVQPSNTGQPYPYQLVANYVPVPDAFEPNDTRATAKPIALDEPFEAYLFAGYRSNTITRDAYEDWYELPALAVGNVAIELSSVPATMSSHLYLYGPDGALLAQKTQTTTGAESAITYEIEDAGTHWVRVNYFASEPKAAGLSTSGVPSTFTDPYTLHVTQTPP